MTIWGRILLITAGLLFGSAIASAQSKPLFETDETLNLTITAPIKELVRTSKRSTEPFPASFQAGGPEDPAEIGTVAARGKSRRTRGVCRFPPIRIRLAKRPKSGVFSGQKSLKLVTHCKNNYEDNVLMEYAAYRMFNVLTPYSHKVRLVKVSYVDVDNKMKPLTRYGFLIEDADDMAARSQMVELDIAGTTQSALDPEAAARIELFNYLLSNLDYSLVKAAPESDCCHNTKIISVSDQAGIQFPVPYDFDNTGWVDPDYALLPQNVDVNSLRERVFRGQCSRMNETRKQRDIFLAKRADLEYALGSVPDLSEKRRKQGASFLAGFFDVLSDPERFERQIVKACR